MRGLQTLLLAVSTRANGAATTAAPAATTAAPAPCSEQDTWGCDEAECAAMGGSWRCDDTMGCWCEGACFEGDLSEFSERIFNYFDLFLY